MCLNAPKAPLGTTTNEIECLRTTAHACTGVPEVVLPSVLEEVGSGFWGSGRGLNVLSYEVKSP